MNSESNRLKHCLHLVIWWFFSSSVDTNIIPQHQTCCGQKGYDNNTHTCSKNKTIIDIKINDSETDVNTPSPPRNGGSSAGTTGICNTCLWNPRCIYTKIKAGEQSVCKTYSRYFVIYLYFFLFFTYTKRLYQVTFFCLLVFSAYKIRINKTVRSGIFWTMHGKLLKGNKDARTIRLIVPCKSGKLNKTGEFLLLTDSTIDRKTVKLGDSDLLLQEHLMLRKIIPKKQQTCRKLSLFVRQFQKAKKDINEIINKMLRSFRYNFIQI